MIVDLVIVSGEFKIIPQINVKNTKQKRDNPECP